VGCNVKESTGASQQPGKAGGGRVICKALEEGKARIAGLTLTLTLVEEKGSKFLPEQLQNSAKQVETSTAMIENLGVRSTAKVKRRPS
jgi:hypothetical protein